VLWELFRKKSFLTIVKLNAPLKIVNGAITSSNLIGVFSSSISVDAFNAF
jgi:hypothetical protein